MKIISTLLDAIITTVRVRRDKQINRKQQTALMDAVAIDTLLHLLDTTRSYDNILRYILGTIYRLFVFACTGRLIRYFVQGNRRFKWNVL